MPGRSDDDETHTVSSGGGSGGSGCLMIAGLLILLMVGAAVLGGNKSNSALATGSQNSTDTKTTDVLSNNTAEVMSRNQLNLFSRVYNLWVSDGSSVGEFLGELKDDSTTTTSTSTDTRTSTQQNVTGDDNNVRYSSTGQKLCPDPNNPNSWGDVKEWCDKAGIPFP